MILESGVGLLAVTLLLFGCAYGLMRRPAPKPWADTEGFATAVCLLLTTLVASTLGIWTQIVLQYERIVASVGMVEAAIGAGVVVAAVLAMRALMAPARRSSGDAAIPRVGMPEDLPPPANHNGSDLRHAA